MYLSIPAGMVFEQADNEVGIKTDYFVDPRGEKARINIQEALKIALQNNKGRAKTINARHSMIYRSNPPDRDEHFLHYVPNHNGKFSSTIPTKLVKGRLLQPIRTSFGCLWYKEVYLSEERLAEVMQKRAEQRDNRRHVGPSPNPT